MKKDRLQKTDSLKNNLKYSPVLNKVVEAKLLEGLTVQTICKDWEINVSTFFRWCDRYPSFKEAVKEGKHGKTSKVAKALYDSALGYTVQEKTTTLDAEGKPLEMTVSERYIKPSVTAQKHILSTQSRKSDKWKDTQDITVTRKLETVLQDIDKLEVIDAEVIE